MIANGLNLSLIPILQSLIRYNQQSLIRYNQLNYQKLQKLNVFRLTVSAKLEQLK